MPCACASACDLDVAPPPDENRCDFPAGRTAPKLLSPRTMANRATAGWGLSSVVVFVAACHGVVGGDAEPGRGMASAPPPPAIAGAGAAAAANGAPNGSAPSPPAAPSDDHRIHGHVVVRALRPGFAFVGDGSRFAGALVDGKIAFDDPSLVGPQTITFVAEPSDDLGGPSYAFVQSVADVDRDEVWIPIARPFVPHVRAKIVGTVSGVGQPDHVYITANGDCLTGSTALDAFGAFTLTVSETCATPGNTVDLAATADVAVGLETAIAIPPAPSGGGAPAEVSRDIAIDHARSHDIAVTVHDAGFYGPVVFSELTYWNGAHFVDSMYAQSASASFTLPGVFPSAPFDQLTATIRVSSGITPSGMTATAYVPSSPNATSAIVDLPRSEVRLDAPPSVPLGSTDGPPSARLGAGADVAWSHVAKAAQVVSVLVESTAGQPRADGSYVTVRWSILAPATRPSFRLFALPAGVAAARELPVGAGLVAIEEQTYGGGTRLEDVLGAPGDAVAALQRTRGLQSGWYQGSIVVGP